MKPRTLASSSTLDGIVGLVSEYYGGLKTLVLTACADGDTFALSNSNGPIQNVRVAHRRGRFYFERLESR